MQMMQVMQVMQVRTDEGAREMGLCRVASDFAMGTLRATRHAPRATRHAPRATRSTRHAPRAMRHAHAPRSTHERTNARAYRIVTNLKFRADRGASGGTRGAVIHRAGVVFPGGTVEKRAGFPPLFPTSPRTSPQRKGSDSLARGLAQGAAL